MLMWILCVTGKVDKLMHFSFAVDLVHSVRKTVYKLRWLDQQYFSHNFDIYRLFIIFGMNHPDNLCDKKIVKHPINTCTTLRNDDVIEKCHFRKKRNARIHFASTVASNFAGSKVSWLKCVGNMHYKVYKTCIADLDNLKHRIRTEWAKLDHAVIAASVHQWHHLSGCVKAGDVHFEHCFWFRHCVLSDNCDLSCHWSVQSNTCMQLVRPVWFNCSCQLWLCALQ